MLRTLQNSRPPHDHRTHEPGCGEPVLGKLDGGAQQVGEWPGAVLSGQCLQAGGGTGNKHDPAVPGQARIGSPCGIERVIVIRIEVADPTAGPIIQQYAQGTSQAARTFRHDVLCGGDCDEGVKGVPSVVKDGLTNLAKTRVIGDHNRALSVQQCSRRLVELGRRKQSTEALEHDGHSAGKSTLSTHGVTSTVHSIAWGHPALI